jgi:hypothetical protein
LASRVRRLAGWDAFNAATRLPIVRQERHVMKGNQMGLFGFDPAAPAVKSTLGQDPDRRGTARPRAKKSSDLVGQRYLIVPLEDGRGGWAYRTSTCPKCRGELVGTVIDGKPEWLDVASRKAAGKNSRGTARLHSEVCLHRAPF